MTKPILHLKSIQDILLDFGRAVGVVYDPGRDTVTPPGFAPDWNRSTPAPNRSRTVPEPFQAEEPEVNKTEYTNGRVHRHLPGHDYGDTVVFETEIDHKGKQDVERREELTARDIAYLKEAFAGQTTVLDLEVAAEIKGQLLANMSRSDIVAFRKKNNLKHRSDGSVKLYQAALNKSMK